MNAKNKLDLLLEYTGENRTSLGKRIGQVPQTFHDIHNEKIKSFSPNVVRKIKAIFPNLKKLSPKEAMKKEWYVGCKFYDPTQKAKYPKGYFWRKKGLAEYKNFKEKRELEELKKISFK